MSASLPHIHRQASQRYGDRTAIQFRRDGKWQTLSWTEYRRVCDEIAAALLSLGVQPADRVGIFSANRAEWLIADHGILSCAAADVPIHAPSTAQQAAYQLSHSESIGIFVGDEAQAQKIRQILPEIPTVRFIVGLGSLSGTWPIPAFSWSEFLQRGEQFLRENPSAIGDREKLINSSTLATIIYTSGTTGLPKGVMLTHGNLASNAQATLDLSDFGPDDTLLSWLPYSHIYARTVDHYLTHLSGSRLVLSPSPETVLDDVKDIHPTWITSVPRLYEKVWASVESLPEPNRSQQLHALFGPNMRQLSSGGAPLPRHVCEGFHACGVPIYEGYGLTESSPVISFNCAAGFRIGSVGRLLPDVEVQIATDGEILTRGPHVMRGYWKNPQATAEAITPDRWLHTGDVGKLEDGFLYITDRKKDLIITSGGKNISPVELERLLISDEAIDQAVVYGDRRPCVVALVVPNFNLLNAQVASLGISIQEQGEFITNPELIQWMQSRVDRVMQVVSQPERVKNLLLLNRPFRLDADELTATMKVRRRFITTKFESQLNALYD